MSKLRFTTTMSIDGYAAAGRDVMLGGGAGEGGPTPALPPLGLRRSP
jgi:hypothetical protein